MGYIYARAIYKGTKTLADVPTRWHDATVAAYYDLYGIHLEND